MTSKSGRSRVEELLEAMVRLQMAPLLASELTDPKLKQIWDMTGTASREQIVKKLKVGSNTVAQAWKRWETLGLIVKRGHQYQRVV